MTGAWIWHIVLFVFGFLILVKGAHWLVEGGSSLARIFGVSDFLIGMTMIAVGTSLPEMFIDITAAIRGNTGLVVGDIIGSNVTNILLVLGIAAVIYPLKIHHDITWREIPFTFLAALVVLVLGNDILLEGGARSLLGRIDGLVLLCFLAIFVYYLGSLNKRSIRLPEPEVKKSRKLAAAARVAGGLVGLFLGSQAIVRAAIFIAGRMRVSETVIGLTAVAVGSSLPELTASIVAALRKHSDLALGNIVGSNIVNIFMVLGICAVIRPLPLRPQDNFAVGTAILASVLLFASAFIGRKSVIDRWIGGAFVGLYAAYLAIVVYLG